MQSELIQFNGKTRATHNHSSTYLGYKSHSTAWLLQLRMAPAQKSRVASVKYSSCDHHPKRSKHCLAHAEFCIREPTGVSVHEYM